MVFTFIYSLTISINSTHSKTLVVLMTSLPLLNHSHRSSLSFLTLKFHWTPHSHKINIVTTRRDVTRNRYVAARHPTGQSKQYIYKTHKKILTSKNKLSVPHIHTILNYHQRCCCQQHTGPLRVLETITYSRLAAVLIPTVRCPLPFPLSNTVRVTGWRGRYHTRPSLHPSSSVGASTA